MDIGGLGATLALDNRRERPTPAWQKLGDRWSR